GRAGGPDGAGDPMQDRPFRALRPEELFLSRPSEGLSDLDVRAAALRAWPGRNSFGRQEQKDRPDPDSYGGGRRKKPARRDRGGEPCRPQPRRGAAPGDRQRARHPDLGRGGRLPEEAAGDPGLYGGFGRRYGEGEFPVRRQRLDPAGRQRPVRDPRRDQKYELVPVRPEGDRL